MQPQELVHRQPHPGHHWQSDVRTAPSRAPAACAPTALWACPGGPLLPAHLLPSGWFENPRGPSLCPCRGVTCCLRTRSCSGGPLSYPTAALSACGGLCPILGGLLSVLRWGRPRGALCPLPSLCPHGACMGPAWGLHGALSVSMCPCRCFAYPPCALQAGAEPDHRHRRGPGAEQR